MVSESDVIMAYRLLMGREPENAQVVADHARHHRSLLDMRAQFMTSPEFRAMLDRPIRAPADKGVKPLTWPAADIEYDVPPDVLDRMIKRIEGEFLYLGEHEPHWSVLTADRFKAKNISRHEEQFFNSGEEPVHELRIAASRSGLDLSLYQSCFELGCGVARSTIWLARQFPKVTGGDISASHLAHARRTAERFGLNNISFLQLNEVRRYRELPPFDVFFSLIVLQHNPPPLMAYILETILDRLSPGGIAYFQIPTYGLDYVFSSGAYLMSSTPLGEVEVHCLPQSALFEIVARTGCDILEIREDGALGANMVSNRLLLRKRKTSAGGL
jgi:SAM-dependent methyltransferase